MAETEIKKSNILVVEDEREHAQVMCEALTRLGHKCDVTYNLAEAQAKLAKKQYDVVVTDLVMEGRREGLDVLREVLKKQPAPPVVVVTAHGDVATGVEAMKAGAYDFIEKPLDLDYFRAQVNRAEKAALQKENQILQAQVMESAGFEGIVGKSAAMQKIIQTARQVAGSDIPVLIMGESGTGKELFARAIHNNSRRRKERLVTLNCAGLSESILEDELFGHIKGAFTGANTEREGRFEHADGGTLFMDEIGDMPQTMQAKLLRVLENGEVVRLGSNDPVRVDVRLISATNRVLDEMVAEKKFREDLYFRIKGVTIDIPPLRERREDIPLLVHFFLQNAAERYGKQVDGIAPEAQQILMSYSWPGNVRQLKNVIENMVVLSAGPTLGADSVPTDVRPAGGEVSLAGGMNGLVGISIWQAEKELIRNTLKMVNGNREQAAKILGIGERTLYRKIKEYDLSMPTSHSNLRVGHGYDIHRLKQGGELVMGGVVVAQGISAVAHSDGDVVIHAIVDALLGALGLGDIGEHFPDTDPAYGGANSVVFLEKLRQHLTGGNWQVVNCDVTILAERPKVRYIKPKMKTFLETALGSGQVNIKAGTNEECGEIGRGEAVAAHAVVLLARAE